MSFRGEQRPEPGRCWIRHHPTAWPAPESPWIHLAKGTWGPDALVRQVPPEDGAATLEELGRGSLGKAPDLIYLPPAPADLQAARGTLATTLRSRGVPVLVQEVLGVEGAAKDAVPAAAASPQALPAPPQPALTQAATGRGPQRTVLDPTPVLLAFAAGGLGLEEMVERLAEAEPDRGTLLWPLLPGISDDPKLQARACEVLAAAGAVRVQPLTPVLAPQDCRSLLEAAEALAPREGSAAPVERLDELHRALFHSAPLDERAFARRAAAAGLDPLAPRPLPAVPGSLAARRRAAGRLAQAADLWLRLGRRESTGSALFRAGRWIEASGHDPEALVREGNLVLLASVEAFAGQDRRVEALLWELFDPEGAAETPFADLRREYLA